MKTDIRFSFLRYEYYLQRILRKNFDEKYMFKGFPVPSRFLLNINHHVVIKRVSSLYKLSCQIVKH